MLHGYGMFKFAKTGSYEGNFKENRRNGQGVYKWPNGDIYDGAWQEG